MKPLERIFFQACLMNCRKYDSLLRTEYRTIRDIVKQFTDMGFPQKRLLYYLGKWDGKGFYEHGVTIDLGWFCPAGLKGEYKKEYDALKKEGKVGEQI